MNHFPASHNLISPNKLKNNSLPHHKDWVFTLFFLAKFEIKCFPAPLLPASWLSIAFSDTDLVLQLWLPYWMEQICWFFSYECRHLYYAIEKTTGKNSHLFLTVSEYRKVWGSEICLLHRFRVFNLNCRKNFIGFIPDYLFIPTWQVLTPTK